MKIYRLLWEFSNNHEWHKDYATMDDLEDGLFNMDLANHPNVTSIKVEEIEMEAIK